MGILTEKQINRAIKRKSLDGISLFFYGETDSTNARAKEFASSGEWHGERAVFIAAKQNAGRGRLGRSFHSPGTGLYLSFLYKPECEFNAAKITANAAVITARAIDSLTGAKTELKWVNDVYLGKKKLAGILTEGRISDSGFEYAIIGIGINVKKTDFPDEVKKIATDIETETKKRISIAKLAAEILHGLTLNINDTLIDEYRSRSFLIGKELTVIKQSTSYTATAIAIDDSAKLVVKLPNGETEALDSGEVSVRAQ